MPEELKIIKFLYRFQYRPPHVSPKRTLVGHGTQGPSFREIDSRTIATVTPNGARHVNINPSVTGSNGVYLRMTGPVPRRTSYRQQTTPSRYYQK